MGPRRGRNRSHSAKSCSRGVGRANLLDVSQSQCWPVAATSSNAFHSEDSRPSGSGSDSWTMTSVWGAQEQLRGGSSEYQNSGSRSACMSFVASTWAWGHTSSRKFKQRCWRSVRGCIRTSIVLSLTSELYRYRVWWCIVKYFIFRAVSEVSGKLLFDRIVEIGVIESVMNLVAAVHDAGDKGVCPHCSDVLNLTVL